MRNVRVRWIALAIACFIVPAWAQDKKPAEPAKQPPAPAEKKKEEPKKDAPKAEPAKPAAAKEEPKKDAPKPAAAAEKKEEPKAATAAKVEIGKPAPEFALKDVEGKDVKMADMKGKIVILEWVNAGCPVCQRHAKAKTAANTMAAYKDKPVVWVNIDSTDGAKADDIKKFMKENNVTAQWLMDPTGATGKAYGAKTTPHMFVIDTKGNLAYMGAIDDDKDGTKGDKAKNYVKEAVDALLKNSAVATVATESYGCTVKYKG